MTKQFKKTVYSVTVLLMLWTLLSLTIGPHLFPWPHKVLRRLLNVTINGALIIHLLYSTARIFTAIVLSLLIGVPIGLLTGVHKSLDEWVTPVLYLLYPLPKIAFLPVFMALFGLGDFSKIILLFTVLIFQILLSTRDGVKKIPIELHHAAATLQLTPKEKLFKLYLPHALPHITSALRISIGISMAVLFFGENYATTYGIGYYIMNNWIMANYTGMFAGIIALGLLAGALIHLLDLLERFLCPWRLYDRHENIS